LGFIGITDVALIAAERFNQEDQTAIRGIQSQIVQLAQQAA
jgi:FMN-dependent NADH-azoreductase